MVRWSAKSGQGPRASQGCEGHVITTRFSVWADPPKGSSGPKPMNARDWDRLEKGANAMENAYNEAPSSARAAVAKEEQLVAERGGQIVAREKSNSTSFVRDS